MFFFKTLVINFLFLFLKNVERLNQIRKASLNYREEGNKVLSAINDSFEPVIKELKLKEAYRLFEKSIDQAKTDAELSIAYKDHSNVAYDLFK